jgi:hypothetical protein
MIFSNYFENKFALDFMPTISAFALQYFATNQI